MKKMNNFTKTEALPKTGHVNEVCKEWLVREDGALAYKLQSEEITDFYKGNRFRNAVVREDFPTALHEQIKEKENAEKQTEVYRRRLSEQEEHDKRVAKEIAEKLERDLQEQQQREFQESEIIAQKMQEIYVNLPPPPPPATRDKSKPPPRPAKGGIFQQSANEQPTTSTAANYRQHYKQQQQQLQHQHFQNHHNTNGFNNSTHHATGQIVKLSPEKYDQLVGNDAALSMATAAAERHMQQHADDIDVYVDPCDYASLREIGLPIEEIKEMSKKIKQEQKDELLARRLQEMEANDGLTQEERDRLLAIEAQDKELAKMLQDREKAKAKRAKEKARIRKSQQKESTTTSCASTSNGLHCGPLLPLPQDCMSSSKHSKSGSVHNAEPQVSSVNVHGELLDAEAYSNPIDVINQQRRLQNGSDMGSINGSSLTRQQRHHHEHNGRDDDIYTLPVDNCHPGQRPVSLNIGPESGHITTIPSQHNSMTRSENYSLESHDSLNGHDISPRINYSKPGSFDQNSSPTPPYMPIQGTRRSNSNEERKKKSKDKCTHQ